MCIFILLKVDFQGKSLDLRLLEELLSAYAILLDKPKFPSIKVVSICIPTSIK